MGCICSKGIYPKDKVKDSIKSSKKYVASSRKDDVVVEVDGCINDATARLISSPLETVSEGDKNKQVVISRNANEKPVRNLQRRLTIDIGAGSVPNGEKSEQVVAGWPPWLTAVAGEAIAGWAPRRAESFEKLEKIGQGTYSSVYKARDLETYKIVALTKVRFANMDPESVRFMAREIIILRKLDHPNVMRLEGLITSKVSGSLYLVFEYMEHDLAGLAATPGMKFPEEQLCVSLQIKCYMHQLFRGLEHCHAHGVLHRDIKGSNLLIDNNGNLKIGDFGLATFFQSHLKQHLTSRVVTLWYRPPELLLGATDYGASVDLWSSGCILAELLAGKPIMPGRTESRWSNFIKSSSFVDLLLKNTGRSQNCHMQQHSNLSSLTSCLSETYKDLPRSALAMLDILLAVEPGHRGSTSSALQNEFFTTQPLPADPSTMPKYPPSKEFDAKLRDEENRRRKASGGNGRGNDLIIKDKDSKVLRAPNVNADFSLSKQKRKANAESMTTKLGNSKGATQSNISRSGPLVNIDDSGSLRIFNPREDSALRRPTGEYAKMTELVTPPSSHIQRNAVELSRFSNSVAVRGSSQLDPSQKNAGVSNWLDESFNKQLGGDEMSEKLVWSHSLLDRPNSSHKKGKEQYGKEYPMGNSPRKFRIHYSGPLLPPGGNVEEMLKEHERQIQHAVHKARLDEAKSRNGNGSNGQTKSLLYGTQARGW